MCCIFRRSPNPNQEPILLTPSSFCTLPRMLSPSSSSSTHHPRERRRDPVTWPAAGTSHPVHGISEDEEDVVVDYPPVRPWSTSMEMAERVRRSYRNSIHGRVEQVDEDEIQEPVFWEYGDDELSIHLVSGAPWPDTTPITVLDRLIAQSSPIRILYQKLVYSRRRHSRIEIPLVLDVRKCCIVAVGAAVTWPDGLAKRILAGEFSVVSAVFSKKVSETTTPPESTAPKLVKQKTGSAENLQLKYAIADAQGQRARMEDRFSASMTLSQDTACIAIFDGHAGAEAATTASECLIDELRKTLGQHDTPPSDTVIERALITTFERVEHIVLTSMHELKCHAGTTALVCIFTPSSLTVANLGDSRAVLTHRDGRVTVLTTDHKATLPSEIERISHVQDAFIDASGYVGGLLQVARAFGDLDDFDVTPGQHLHKIKGVSAVPDVYSWPLDLVQDEFLTLACDGLWDVISSEGASEFVHDVLLQTQGDLRRTAQALVEFALERRSMDNVTVALVSFRESGFWRGSMATARGSDLSSPPQPSTPMMGRASATSMSEDSRTSVTTTISLDGNLPLHTSRPRMNKTGLNKLAQLMSGT